MLVIILFKVPSAHDRNRRYRKILKRKRITSFLAQSLLSNPWKVFRKPELDYRIQTKISEVPISQLLVAVMT